MEQLDPQAVNLAKAIRQTESQNNPQARGKSGEYGAYQFTQPTWEKYSKAHGVNVPLEQSTLEQQNEVAYKQIKEWKDQGYGVGEIASMWNSGKPDAYKDTSYKGVNKMGVSYDVPAYAKSVAEAYQAIKNGQPVSPSNTNPSTVQAQPQPGKPNAQGYITSVDIPDAPPDTQSGALGTNPNDSLFGKLTNNSLTRGLIKMVPGAQTVGDYIGTSLGSDYTKLKDLAQGTNNYENYDKSIPNPLQLAAGTAGVLGTAYTAGTAGSALSGLLKSSSALETPIVKSIFEKYIPQTIGEGGIDQYVNGAINNAQKLDALTEALAKASASEKLVIQKAIEEITPSVIKELGVGTFAQNYPVLAKGLGLLGGLAKGGARVAADVAGLGILKNFIK